MPPSKALIHIVQRTKKGDAVTNEFNNENSTPNSKDIEIEDELDTPLNPKPASSSIDTDADTPHADKRPVTPKQNDEPTVIDADKKGNEKTKLSRFHFGSQVLFLIIPIFAFVVFLLIWAFQGDDLIKSNSENIGFGTRFVALGGLIAGVFGSFLAAMIEMSPPKSQAWKAWGAIARFWGSMISFSALYILLLSILL